MFVAAMGSHADDIVGDYFESEDWAALVEGDAEPEELTPPAPPPAETS
jgi:hypothetical protein